MPSRYLNSSILKWPDRKTVDEAVRRWAEEITHKRKEVISIGYFGSYARGNWGVGSDVDLAVVVEHSDQPFERRSAQWDATKLPVPADVLIYTKEEWQSLSRQGGFYQTLMKEVIWVYPRF